MISKNLILNFCFKNNGKVAFDLLDEETIEFKIIFFYNGSQESQAWINHSSSKNGGT